MDTRSPEQIRADEDAALRKTYGKLAGKRADHVILDETAQFQRDREKVLEQALEEERARVKPAEPEVKYTPNRAQRRAAQKAARRSVRRGQRAADRRVKELEDGMTPEEIERARRLAAKTLGGRRG